MMYRCADVPMCRCADVLICQCADSTLTPRHSNGERKPIGTSTYRHISTFIFILLFPISFLLSSLHAQSETEWLERSFVYLENQQLDSAEIALKKQLSLYPANPINPFLLNNLGTIQRRLGNKEDALLSYTAALGAHPDNKTFLHARASLFAEMSQAANAILDYSKILESYPNDEESLYQRGLLYLQMRNLEGAEADFRKLLDLHPDGLYPRMGLASLAKFNGDLEEAEKIYNYLLDKEPEMPELYAGRAELYILMNKGSKASNDATKAIRLTGDDNPNPYYYVIRYRAKTLLRETESADADYRKAIELGYDTGQ
ncbi:tetratricopeptide repeat protein [Bacteroidales bacterium OttesenSCG-928-A17]|nr:tetratricopeptide repeat protein [Bacteroidales bacterium OttesenSCG-928-A17]